LLPVLAVKGKREELKQRKEGGREQGERRRKESYDGKKNSGDYLL